MAEPQIRLIVGLGNPGAEYARTRHNAGFWFVDELAAGAKANWKRETRFQSAMARASIAGQEVWLLKPQTMMNGSGAAVGAATRFYQIAPDELLVVHDEIDLP
ncbi:MAG TPA: aminoacyl-tRNA hydrolase, partial [Steroidobacteraceae bacterium]|nr:aminoacyl-tRNA hydrolase [Steroidobacteraceae bacterium]